MYKIYVRKYVRNASALVNGYNDNQKLINLLHQCKRERRLIYIYIYIYCVVYI